VCCCVRVVLCYLFGRTGHVLWCIGFFFFQAEDGIRDWSVTGVQTCALPISHRDEARDIADRERREAHQRGEREPAERHRAAAEEIGRASCRERVENSGGDGPLKKKETRGRADEGRRRKWHRETDEWVRRGVE